MTVIQNSTLLVNNWFADRIICSVNFSKVYSCIYIFSQNFFIFNCFFERRNAGVLFAVDVESSTVFNNFSFNVVKFDSIISRFMTWQFISVYTCYNCFYPVIICFCFCICWSVETSIVQLFNLFFCQSSVTTFGIPSATMEPVLFSRFFNSCIENILSQFYIRNCFDFVCTFCPVSIIYFLIFSVQRHPDNVTWFEVYCFVVVDSSCCVSDDVTVFVCYKQRTIKCKTFWPRCCVVGSCVVGNSKSVSAHAKYHSRSHSYGKYFFHSLSSS